MGRKSREKIERKHTSIAQHKQNGLDWSLT